MDDEERRNTRKEKLKENKKFPYKRKGIRDDYEKKIMKGGD